MLDNYEDFDAGTEVLEMLRGGFGLKDAPRLWNLVFSEVLTTLSYFPCRSDMEIMCKHVTRNGNLTLVGLVAKHVDERISSVIEGRVSTADAGAIVQRIRRDSHLI